MESAPEEQLDDKFTILGPAACPNCGRAVSICSPNWLHIGADYPTRKGNFVIEAHKDDLCISCLLAVTPPEWRPVGEMLRRTRERLGLSPNIPVFHLRGPLEPADQTLNLPVTFDEFFLWVDRSIPPDWQYPSMTIRNPDGSVLHRMWVAIRLSTPSIDGAALIIWSGGHRDGSQADSLLCLERWEGMSLSERNTLVRLARNAAKRAGRPRGLTNWELDQLRAEARAFFLDPLEEKKTLNAFRHRLSIPPSTWYGYVKLFDIDWRAWKREFSPGTFSDFSD